MPHSYVTSYLVLYYMETVIYLHTWHASCICDIVSRTLLYWDSNPFPYVTCPIHMWHASVRTGVKIGLVWHQCRSLLTSIQVSFDVNTGLFWRKYKSFFTGGPEPVEKEIHEILDSKREDRFSKPFFELVQKMCQVHFSYLPVLWLGNFCKGPRTLRKFPQKCQKIAGYWGRAVYVRNLQSPRNLAHPPASLERPGPAWDNITSQPWLDVTCLCNTTSNTLSCHF